MSLKITDDIPHWVQEELNEELINNISKDSVKKAVMDTKTALLLITLINSNSKHWPFSIRDIWYKTFPSERMPTDNLHNISMEQSISYEEVKRRLLEAAVNFLSDKINYLEKKIDK